MFIKDQLEFENKPEDCAATKILFCFLFLSLIPEGSSFFKRSSLSWYKQRTSSMIYTTAIWFLTYKDAFEAFSHGVTWRLPLPPTLPKLPPQALTHYRIGNAWKPVQQRTEMLCEILMQVRGVPAQMKPVMLLVNWNWASIVTSERVVARRLSQVSQGRSTGYSSHRENFKKPMHCNSSTETRQKKLRIVGTQTRAVSFLCRKGEETLIF